MTSFDEWLEAEKAEVKRRQQEADRDIERINATCITGQIQAPTISGNLVDQLPCLQPPVS